MKPLKDQHLAIFRRHMVEIIDMHFDLSSDELGRSAPSPRLREALLKVPRHLFVAPQLMAVAYQDMPLPIGFDKTVSQPFISAAMIDLLDLTPGMRVLEIGTGLGYQTALLAEIGAQVWSVEIVEEFAESAGMRLAALGYEVAIRVGDGSRGWPQHAPFDAIIVSAAAAAPPPSLIEQLAPGGRMVLPVGTREKQQLTLIDKSSGGVITDRALMPVIFSQLETAEAPGG